MKKVQIIMYSCNSQEVKVDIPIDLYQQVCNDMKDETSREELAWNFENVVRERYPTLHQYLLKYLNIAEWSEKNPETAHYGLATDWFEAKESVFNVRFGIEYIHKESPKWADDIVALGKEVWSKFPSLQKLNEFIEHYDKCHCVINTITADDEFAGFAIMLRLSTREGEIYDYDAMYACMTAIKQKFRNHGLGERLLRHITNSYGCPMIVTSNPFIGAAEKKQRMRAFYEQNGFERTPMGWTDNEQNEYDVFVKGQMNMEAWVAISERVQELWHDIETI